MVQSLHIQRLESIALGLGLSFFMYRDIYHLPFIAGSPIPILWPCRAVCSQRAPGGKELLPFWMKLWHKQKQFFWHTCPYRWWEHIEYKCNSPPSCHCGVLQLFLKKLSHLPSSCQEHLIKADNNNSADPVLCFRTQSKYHLYLKKWPSIFTCSSFTSTYKSPWLCCLYT